jgi:hypothetical protein
MPFAEKKEMKPVYAQTLHIQSSHDPIGDREGNIIFRFLMLKVWGYAR